MAKKKSQLRTVLLWSMITFFVVGGLLGAGFFLFGSFGEIQGKILATVFSLAIFSLLGMVSAGRLNSKQKNLAIAGVASSVLAAGLVQFLIWGGIDFDNDIIKIIMILSIISFAVAHSLLVWAKSKKGLQTLVMYATLILIAVVAAMLIYVVIIEGEVSQVFWRVFGFVAVLDVVGTIVVGLMRRL